MAESLNKSELVAAIAAEAGLTQKDAGAALDAFFAVVAKSVGKGTKVSVPGWIAFDQSSRAARTGRNPATGETIQIAASKGVKISAGSKLKAAVK
jgi:DNA-binding protein HU-beta